MQLNMCEADGAAVKHPRTEERDEPRLQLLARLVDKTAESSLPALERLYPIEYGRILGEYLAHSVTVKSKSPVECFVNAF